MGVSEPKLEQVYLLPGELVITNKPQKIVTVLGSCVTVIMFHPHSRTAAMCHGMLPEPPPNKTFREGNSKQARIDRYMYLSKAIPEMVTYFNRLGGIPAQTIVKVFGGSEILSDSPEAMRSCAAGERTSIGTANLRSACRLLENTPYKVAAFDVGGTRGRKIIFSTRTGQVLHRYLSESFERTKL